MILDERDLENYINKYFETYAITFCKQAAIEITEFAKSAIEQFYNDYSPEYYNRYFDLLNNSYQLYYKNNGNMVYGGVRLSPDKMSDYVKSTNYTTPKEDVFEWTWMHGYHGYSNHNPSNRIQTFPPVAMVQMKMGDKTFLENLHKKAKNAVNKQSFKYFQ